MASNIGISFPMLHLFQVLCCFCKVCPSALSVLGSRSLFFLSSRPSKRKLTNLDQRTSEEERGSLGRIQRIFLSSCFSYMSIVTLLQLPAYSKFSLFLSISKGLDSSLKNVLLQLECIQARNLSSYFLFITTMDYYSPYKPK